VKLGAFGPPVRAESIPWNLTTEEAVDAARAGRKRSNRSTKDISSGRRSELELGRAYRKVSERHADEPDVYSTCQLLAGQCDAHADRLASFADRLASFADRYGENEDNEPPELYSDLFGGTRDGTLGFLRDLHDLYIMASEADISWMLVGQAAQGARDQDLFGTVSEREGETAAQLKWLKTRMKQSASPDPAGSEAMSALPTANVQPVMPPLSADRGHPRGSRTPRGIGARTPST
jgi:hypothetical protein